MADIAKIAVQISDWQTVAHKLGFGPVEIRDIENKHMGPADETKSILRTWIWKNGNRATYGKLCDVLEKLDQQGAADEIRKIAQEK